MVQQQRVDEGQGEDELQVLFTTTALSALIYICILYITSFYPLKLVLCI